MSRNRNLLVAELLIAAVLAVPAWAFAQQPGDSGSSQDSTPTQSPDSTPQSGQAPVSAGATRGLFARALNSASPLTEDNGPVQWGWLSLREASFVQYYTEVTLDSPTLGPETAHQQVSQLTTNLVLNHAFGAAHTTQLTVQYNPSLFVTEGHAYTNALNQTAGIDTIFLLNPRWTLQLGDRFSFYGRQRSFSSLTLDANYTLGTLAQNNFLNGPSRIIYTTLAGTLTYLWSPVTRVSFTPTVGYQDATGAANSGQDISAITGGGQLSVYHDLSATRTIGVNYTALHSSYTNSSTSAGPQSSSWQQDFLLNYGQQLGATWRMSLGLGVANNTGGNVQTGVAASAGLTKSFHKMDFALSYYRGHQFNGYITDQTSNRVDLLHTLRWSRRITTTTSVAYFKTANGAMRGPSGVYAMEHFGFGLTRSLSFTTGFSYTKQTGDRVYLLSGKTRVATVGITWASPTPGSQQY